MPDLRTPAALEGYPYERRPPSGGGGPHAHLRLQMEAWHRAPYIWLMRVIIIGTTLAS